MKKYILLLLTLFALSSCEQEPEIISVDADKKLPKVQVCHYDADSDTWETISVNGNALKAHLAHGDFEGECCPERTYIPDDSFEQQLINKGLDDVLDDYVLTENIIGVSELTLEGDILVIPGGYTELKDLTGIECFKSLEFFRIQFVIGDGIDMLDLTKNLKLKKLQIIECHSLRGLDISTNINLEELSISMFTGFDTIDLSNCVKLEKIHIAGNDIKTLDLSQNVNLKSLSLDEVTQLTDLDLSANILLERVVMIFFIQFTNLDFSSNPNLKTVHINEADQLISVDMKNGKNENIESFFIESLSLECVQVDDEEYSNANWSLQYGNFSEDCGF